MCSHENFAADVAVARILDGDGNLTQFMAEVKVWCTECGEPFGFRGPPPGLSWNEPRVSVDARELHAPLMSPAELELAGPLPAMARGPMVYEVHP